MSFFSISRIYFENTFFSSIDYVFTIFFANFILVLLSQIDFDFTVYFANLLWINYFFRRINMNSLSSTKIHYEFIILLAYSHWIYSFFCERTMNSLPVSLNHYEFTIFLSLIFNLLFVPKFYFLMSIFDLFDLKLDLK